jgi:hypothetical protein
VPDPTPRVTREQILAAHYDISVESVMALMEETRAMLAHNMRADAILALVAPLEAANADLQTRNQRMRGFLQRHGYGHTDWPEDKIGCEKPGVGCVGHCLARCENVDNLNMLVFDLRAALATAQEQNERFVAEIAEARAAWADVSALFDEGILIRDTSKDADFPAFTSQSARIVNALIRIGDALPAPVKETSDG